MQVWELLGRYLVNQTFAADWGFPISRPPGDVIPDARSDPQLRDGHLPSVPPPLPSSPPLATLRSFV